MRGAFDRWVDVTSFLHCLFPQFFARSIRHAARFMHWLFEMTGVKAAIEAS